MKDVSLTVRHPVVHKMFHGENSEAFLLRLSCVTLPSWGKNRAHIFSATNISNLNLGSIIFPNWGSIISHDKCYFLGILFKLSWTSALHSRPYLSVELERGKWQRRRETERERDGRTDGRAKIFSLYKCDICAARSVHQKLLVVTRRKEMWFLGRPREAYDQGQ